MSEATVSDQQLRLFVERVERLEEEKKGISDDIRDTFNEMKSQGYDPKIVKKLLKLRKMAPHDRAEIEAVLSVYCDAVGLQLDLPLALAA
jgi:uncharacterized protein (UPF0335 family)